MEKKEKNFVRALVESAVLIAIAVVLSLLKIVDLPFGGSITVASMLPIILIAYRHGTGWGMLSGVTFSLIQQLLGWKNLNYVHAMYAGREWYVLAGALALVFLLDYLIAFSVAGLAHIFRKPIKDQAMALTAGALFTGVLRFICHVISGATVWAGLSIPTEAAWLYSIGYNATYMIPETIILALVAFYVGGILDFRQKELRMILKQESVKSNVLYWIGGVFITAGVVFLVAMLFKELQNPETGEFMITGLKNVNWLLTGGIFGLSLVIGVVLFIWGGKKKRKQ